MGVAAYEKVGVAYNRKWAWLHQGNKRCAARGGERDGGAAIEQSQDHLLSVATGVHGECSEPAQLSDRRYSHDLYDLAMST